MVVPGRVSLLKSWPRRIALPVLFGVSFAATLGIRLRIGSAQGAAAAPVAAVVPAPRTSAAPVAVLPAQSAAADTAPQVEDKAEAAQATEPPSPSSHVLPPGASYWPPD